MGSTYVALQALKHTITDDPNNVTDNWCGPKVYNYTGVFCSMAPDNPYIQTAAGLDLDRKNITGSLPEDLGLLCGLALIHLAANNFLGTLPTSFSHLKILYELDVSPNALRFASIVLLESCIHYQPGPSASCQKRWSSSLSSTKMDEELFSKCQRKFEEEEERRTSVEEKWRINWEWLEAAASFKDVIGNTAGLVRLVPVN